MQFIKEYNDFVTAHDCDQIIQHFDRCEALGLTENRMQFSGHSPHEKDDSVVKLESFRSLALPESTELYRQIHNIINEAWIEYTNEFSMLKEVLVACPHLWIQRTAKGQGYHVWHHEADNLSTSHRVATFILYLTDITEGGETEFLYQSKRVNPRQGKLVMFPAGYTHTHRGNPVLSDEVKYIVTGWLHFATPVTPK